MNNLLKFPNSDDEEDLEALRLAALQSLKKPSHQDNSQPFEQHSQTWQGKGFRNKRGKYYGAHPRGGKTGHFGRERSTTLISITTVDDKVKDTSPTEKLSSVNEESTSKFARYDKSDDSESESEEEVGSSEEDAPAKLERADSLEALMQELDDEIQGKVKERKETKVKKIRKKKKVSESENKSPNAKESQSNGSEEKKQVEETLQSSGETTTSTSTEVSKVEEEPETAPTAPPVKVFNKKPLRSRSPNNRRGGFYNRRMPRNFQMSQNQPPLLPFPPVQYHTAPPVLPYHDQHTHPFNPLFVPAMNMNPQMQPIFYERPPSPLSINANNLSNVTMAPLSPRSAAFVLENKAIIERRKRSPRRSYSPRSMSRSPRRSLTPRRTPRRSLSPRKSRSPRRLLPRKRSLSPRRKSLSPRRRSSSPKRRNVDRGNGGAHIRDRLGLKNKSDEGVKEAKAPEDDAKKDEKPLDPVLEARKRKFESNEIKVKEGIIRLRPKEDKLREEETKQEKDEEKVKVEKPKENIVEVAPATTTVEEKPPQKEKDLVPDEFKELEMLLNDEITLEPEDNVESPKVDDIFSDEDSASDNEGRFKIKEQRQSAKPPVLSYLKLVNGEKNEIKAEPLLLSTRARHERSARERSKRKIRSTTPPLKKSEPRKEDEKKRVTTSTEKTTSSKHKASPKPDKRPPSMDKRFERKIEIKIKNPSKYERNSKSKVAKIEESIPSKVERKVKVEKEESDNDEEFEPEIVIENDSDEEYLSLNEGDLRAQLSKKRAEKLHKIPKEGVSSRLLKFALQDTILTKKKKKSKDPESKLSSSELPARKKLLHEEPNKFYLSVRSLDRIRFSYYRPITDGRLPIHLRLGIASNSEIFTESRSKRKSRKRKNRELLEQV